MTDEPAQAPEQDRPLDPEKLLRLASMVREMTEEARRLDPDSTPNTHLAEVHAKVSAQIRQALPSELANELDMLDLGGSFDDGATGQEIRIAFSGLIGWLQGLFQGLQAAMQMQAMTQKLQAAAPKDESEEDPTVPGRYL